MEPITELERIKKELARLFSTDTLGRSVNWDWIEASQKYNIGTFKLIAKNLLCEKELKSSLIELIEKYYNLKDSN